MRSTVKWGFILTLIALLAPYRASALGLGDIKLNSYLNQPLDARIVVLPAQAGELDDARIGLAPKSDFEKAGIERRAVLDLIKFKLAKDKDGKPIIKLTSEDPIKEPFLDFILEVTWPKGQLMREYTVLLDPPVTTQEAAPPVQTPVAGAGGAQAPAGRTVLKPETTSVPPSPSVATRSIEPKLTHDSYGPTQRTDTLWSIAKAVRPDTSVSIQQVMLAMVKKNPEAFYDSNVNELKAGYILRIPDKNLINQVSESDAIKEVRLEHQRWMQAKKGAAAPAGATHKSGAGGQAKAKPGGAATSTQGAKNGGQARLKLLPANIGGSGTEPGGGAAAGKGESLNQQLAAAQEQNEAQKQENAQLQSQVKDLSDQVASMQRLLSLKDDTLAVLQNKLSQLQGGDTAANGADVQTRQPPPAAVKQPAPKPAAPKPSAPPVHTIKKPHVVAPPHPARSSLFADPKVLVVGGVVIVLLAALVWIVIRRRQMGTESFIAPEASAQAERPLAAPSAEDPPPASTVVAQSDEYVPSGGDLLEAEVNEIDPLAEADVYMAYRRFQQAEDLLKSAIRDEPQRPELHLKLAEVYAAADNTQAFLAEAENFHSEFGVDNPLWEKMAAMGKEIQPEHPLFGNGEDGGSDDLGAGEEWSQQVFTEPQDDAAGEPGGGTDEVSSLEHESDVGEAFAVDTEQDAGVSAGIPGEEHAEHEPAPAVENNTIEFEAGLTSMLSSEAPEEERAALAPTGNEIDFDKPLGDETSAAYTDDQEVQGGAAGGLQDDVGLGLEDVGDQTDHGAAGETVDTGAGGGLAFDLDEGATKGHNMDNFFEGLDALDADSEEGTLDGSADPTEVGTKLDLARAFMEMGDQEGAKDILKEVVDLGDDGQKQEARELLQQLET